ncbi:sulfatase-like hydrolase/transferase [Aureibaculum sp. 2210JD6-5]|uniref:sulfatase-like hydrolase/transferase n=1 Tax=Aureibaculum sp. 2210JD6-5 TaxID=3103957 RepID=UPI002AACA279|nr:sulfatase-like hydrolase/transferase [Aureibaculum sp. 2210JD6-5]MDY7393987.1 sulfatase-like hydrolase/transferase [Aureibaculum sp. 2210JD6-5]
MKSIIKFLIFLCLFGCKEISQKNTTESKLTEKPNIIFLFSDDQSFKAVNALGNKEIKTPTMDKLAEEGTTFTHTYNMGGWNGAICLASRAMIISGRSIWRAQEVSQNFAKNNDLNKTWPKLMESVGYETYTTGKWHISAKADSIFNHVGHVLRGMPFDTPEGYNRPLSKNDTTWLPWKKEFGGYWEGGKHWSELVKDDAVAFIDSASTKEKPFFMYIAFNAPHDPRQSPKKYVGMYPLDSISIPESFMPKYPYAETMGSGKNLRDEKLAPFPRTEYSVKVNRQEYYAITTHLDDQLKDIINALEEKGLKENTYIFFTSDHGLSVGEHGLIGKQNMYDHSVRVPLMVVGPNIPKGNKVSNDVYLQDVMASALDLGGVEKPNYVEFNSLMGQINGNETKGSYDAIYGTYEKNSQRMIRKDGFKLIVYPKSEKILLYNLKDDPQELKDIASISENKEKIKNLFSELMQLQQTMGDKLDLTSIYNSI